MFYVLDDNKNLVEALDKEGFLAILQQAIASGSLENIDPESAVASRLRSLLNGTAHGIEFVTQAQYNALEQAGKLVEGCYYFITNDDTAEDFSEAIEALQAAISELNTRLATLSFGNPDEEFRIYRKKENGVNQTNIAATRGLYIARVYDQTVSLTITRPSTVIIYFDGGGSGTDHHQNLTSVFRFFYHSSDTVQEHANATIMFNYDGTVELNAIESGVVFNNYTIELRAIGQTV